MMPKNAVYVGNLKDSEANVLQYGYCLYGVLKDNLTFYLHYFLRVE